jgi:hypothetical protein
MQIHKMIRRGLIKALSRKPIRTGFLPEAKKDPDKISHHVTAHSIVSRHPHLMTKAHPPSRAFPKNVPPCCSPIAPSSTSSGEEGK